jgi:hypothetical protein
LKIYIDNYGRVDKMELQEIEACVTQAKKGDKEALTKLLTQYKSYIFNYAYQ